ncbi:MAG: PTS-dependent dihydroxyacetone kinase, ADP-binding subunit DhaL [Candidatus Hydrogenedentes bacterium ADurb.Bin101]|nr:MAG: PTS-dependent dihydroxyacetone kinase, ADP-binding subunit DhaL [Candidatus Hydrogenedentes bacterium ADurb.Bin101]HOC69247.1 dihydroxyacetone kinase subunit DhaL [Candidatus Hydrogenedentota bacterium]
MQFPGLDGEIDMGAITHGLLARMLRCAAAEVREHHEWLSRLDSVGGDGDHGTTMVRAMSRMEQALEADVSGKIQTLLNDVGWAILGVDGGAIGPLLGMFFVSMAEAAEGLEALDAEGLASTFEAGLAGVRAQTKAQLGDKTLVDALVPAVEALRAAAEGGKEVLEALHLAAEAAEAGAELTSTLQARFGRARNIKEQSIGTRDPGATSMALLFRGFEKGVEPHA